MVGTRSYSNLAKAFGPGVLLAGIAIGASHLVQSTRAGADFGLSLLLVIIAACLIRYPAFRAGAQYVSLTGSTLLVGYRRQGLWATGLYCFVALGTMFAAVPAVTLVTAGLAQAVFKTDLPVLTVSALILSMAVLLLAVGGYAVLDKLMKAVILLLFLSTLAATALVVPKIDWALSGSLIPPMPNATHALFIAALIGMMPSSVDISVWHSLWAQARSKQTGYQATPAEALFDFHVGYGVTVFLALCFVLLGAGTMHGQVTSYAPTAAGFAEQLIALYAENLGAWSAPIIGVAAFLAMLSTVLTGLDGYPRVAAELTRIAKSETRGDETPLTRRVYLTSLIGLASGSMVILYFFITSLRVFIDVAATIAFLFAPLIAFLNHRAIYNAGIVATEESSVWLRRASFTAVVLLALISVYFLYLRWMP